MSRVWPRAKLRPISRNGVSGNFGQLFCNWDHNLAAPATLCFRFLAAILWFQRVNADGAINLTVSGGRLELLSR